MAKLCPGLYENTREWAVSRLGGEIETRHWQKTSYLGNRGNQISLYQNYNLIWIEVISPTFFLPNRAHC